MSHLEKIVERDCRRIAERNDCELLKVVSPNKVGVFDRILLGPDSLLIWMEFKREKGGSVSGPQRRRLKSLRLQKHRAFIVSSVEQFCDITGWEA